MDLSVIALYVQILSAIRLQCSLKMCSSSESRCARKQCGFAPARCLCAYAQRWCVWGLSDEGLSDSSLAIFLCFFSTRLMVVTPVQRCMQMGRTLVFYFLTLFFCVFVIRGTNHHHRVPGEGRPDGSGWRNHHHNSHEHHGKTCSHLMLVSGWKELQAIRHCPDRNDPHLLHPVHQVCQQEGLRRVHHRCQ